jgi:multiple sugar transport system permease protein
MLRGVVLSLGEVSLAGDYHFVGLDNYARAFGDPQFLGALWHAAALCLLTLGLGFVLPVALAIYMNELKKGQAWVRLVFFLPFLTPTVPAVILWRWIFDQGYGLINSLLSWLPIEDPHIPWLNEPTLALLSITLVFIWKNTGWNALIYWTSLQDVSEELYETAEMDGTSLWQRIKHVSLPALRGTMAVLLIMQVINTVQIFTEVYLMTGGGPMGSTEVLTTYMYKKSFLYLDIGYASAMAVILFGVLVGFTALRMRRIEEEG